MLGFQEHRFVERRDLTGLTGLLHQPNHHLTIQPCQEQSADAVVLECLPDYRKQWLYDLLADRCRVVPNFLLRVTVHSQCQEVQQVVQIDFPVGLGVGRQRKVLAGLLAGDTDIAPFLLDPLGVIQQFLFGPAQFPAHLLIQQFTTPLAVAFGL